MNDASCKPMSAIMKEMALTTLKNANLLPSPEAIGVGLLLSHVAWQRANEDEFEDLAFACTLSEMESRKPDLWNELHSRDVRLMITKLMALKKRCYPQDKRKIIVCGTLDGKVHVEWTE